MKHIKKTQLYLTLILLITSLLINSISIQAEQPAELTIESLTIGVGETTSAQLYGTGFEDLVGSFLISITFDPSVVSVVDVNKGDIDVVNSYIDNIHGWCNLSGYSLSGITDGFVFAELVIEGIGDPGEESDLTIDYSELLTADPIPSIISYLVNDGTVLIEESSMNPYILVEEVNVDNGNQDTGTIIGINFIETVGSMLISLQFNPDVVMITDVTALDLDSLSFYIDPINGWCNISGYSLSGVNGDFSICDITYEAIGAPGDYCDVIIFYSEMLTAEPVPISLDYDEIDGSVLITTGSNIPRISIDDINIDENGMESAMVSAFDIPESIGSCQMTISWDPTIASIIDVIDGDFNDLFFYLDNSAGLLNIVTVNTNTMLFNDFIICELIFQANGNPGDYSDVTIVESYLFTADPLPTNVAHDSIDGSINILQDTINAMIQLDDVELNTGESKTVSVSAQDFTNTVGSMLLSLSFDPEVISVVDVNDGDLDASDAYVDNINGWCNVSGYSISGITDDFLIAELTIEAIGDPGEWCEMMIVHSEVLSADPFPSSLDHTIHHGFIEISTIDPSEPGSGTSSSKTVITPATNIRPVCDASRSETVGFINAPIRFDGSKSYDDDGTITSYLWDFGDGNTGSEKIIDHQFSETGLYEVVLTITDDEGATDSDILDVNIQTSANNPPTMPIMIQGPEKGSKNTLYTFSIKSTDLDGDDLVYRIDWGDETTMTSEMISQDTSIDVNHQWNQSGRYVITIIADDNKTISSTLTHIILIDAMEIISEGEFIGVITDTNGDGIYDQFDDDDDLISYEEKTKQYLLDIDGDNKWDIRYDGLTGTTSSYQQSENTSAVTDISWMLILGGIIILSILAFAVFALRSKGKKK